LLLIFDGGNGSFFSPVKAISEGFVSEDVFDIGGCFRLEVKVDFGEFIVVHVHVLVGSNSEGFESGFVLFVVVVNEDNILFIDVESEVFGIVTVGFSVGLFVIVPRVVQGRRNRFPFQEGN